MNPIKPGVDAPKLPHIALDLPLYKDGKLVGVARRARWLAWPAGATRKKRILVVDDDKQAAIAISKLLTAEGYQTARAFDGISGLAAARALLPDLVLVNFLMPRLTGMDVLKDLRRDPCTEGIKTILTSADAKVAELALLAGAHDSLHLPISEEGDLIGKVARLLAV